MAHDDDHHADGKDHHAHGDSHHAHTEDRHAHGEDHHHHARGEDHHHHAHGEDHHARGEDHHHHAHDDGHAHAAPRGMTRRDLPRGAGIGKIVFLDAPSGIAGDMTIAALLSLGAPRAALDAALGALDLGGYHLHLTERAPSGIAALHFDVHVDAGQRERAYRDIVGLIERSALDADVKELALAIFRRLGEAEAEVHGTALDDVHFHEVGAVDAIVDVVGSAALLRYLGAEIVVSPLPMGRGRIRAAHGVLPLPAPATLLCLRGVPTVEDPLDVELVTPTGAAIAGTVAARFSRWPAMRPLAIGWGAGTRELPDRPNLLRAVLGEPDAPTTTHVLVETNVDDVTGELVAHALAVMLESGALDAWATPIVMKKGRPGVTVAALMPEGREEDVVLAMLRELPTLGVRRSAVSRVERARRVVEVETRFGAIPVKVGEGFGPDTVKPEHDVCARLARTHGVALREVIQAALTALRA